MKIVLVDLHQSLVDVAKAIGWKDVETMPWTNVKDIKYETGDAFVSPSNSIGYMDGGIDYTLSRLMFQGLEPRVKKAFASKGYVNLLGVPYCPIGEAVVVETGVDGVYLIAAPTMLHPQDVRGTSNPYHAMFAILREAYRHSSKIKRVYLCGLCTGCGMIEPKDAVKMMKAAHDDFMNQTGPQMTLDEILAEQPNWYENTEFKRISPEKVMLHKQ